jgi:hypothetical protein
MASKWFVYGVSPFGIELKADNPAQFHRGWPGVGFTHSLVFGVVIGLLLYLIWRNKVVAYSFVIGQWAHAITDTGDTVGTMLLFPFTDHLFAVGAWAYAGQTGRYTDAGAYFSGLGFVWDGVFVVWTLLSWRVLTRGYFRTTVMAADPFWRWAGRYVSETTLVALYRASFFYGVARWAAWLIWAHVVRSFAFDLRWGGPRWVPAIYAEDLNASQAACKCPGCCSMKPRLGFYGAVAVCARAKGFLSAAKAPTRRRRPRPWQLCWRGRWLTAFGSGRSRPARGRRRAALGGDRRSPRADARSRWRRWRPPRGALAAAPRASPSGRASA